MPQNCLRVRGSFNVFSVNFATVNLSGHLALIFVLIANVFTPLNTLKHWQFSKQHHHAIFSTYRGFKPLLQLHVINVSSFYFESPENYLDECGPFLKHCHY